MKFIKDESDPQLKIRDTAEINRTTVKIFFNNFPFTLLYIILPKYKDNMKKGRTNNDRTNIS